MFLKSDARPVKNYKYNNNIIEKNITNFIQYYFSLFPLVGNE